MLGRRSSGARACTGRGVRGGGWGWGRLPGGDGFAYGQILAHFLETPGADALDGAEIVHALERAVGFAHFENFVGDERANARDLLQFGGAGGVEVNGVERGLFLGGAGGGQGKEQG